MDSADVINETIQVFGILEYLTMTEVEKGSMRTAIGHGLFGPNA